MRDIIWTIIIIWAIWKIMDALRFFSTASKKTSGPENVRSYTQNDPQNTSNPTPKKGELKADAGEYVDFEEIK